MDQWLFHDAWHRICIADVLEHRAPLPRRGFEHDVDINLTCNMVAAGVIAVDVVHRPANCTVRVESLSKHSKHQNVSNRE